ncbi:MAG: hypothetical protein V3W34_15240, partial [Phycisphaerae bacterium]
RNWLSVSAACCSNVSPLGAFDAVVAIGIMVGTHCPAWNPSPEARLEFAQCGITTRVSSP